jgi:hypothetical protein
VNVHVECSFQAEGLVGKGSIVIEVSSINARSICIGFFHSWLENFVFRVIFGVEATFSTSVVTKTKVFDLGKAAWFTARVTETIYSSCSKDAECTSANDAK